MKADAIFDELERIAEKAGVDLKGYRLWLRRGRGDAWKQLEETLERRASGVIAA
jgi:hypothetical protein